MKRLGMVLGIVIGVLFLIRCGSNGVVQSTNPKIQAVSYESLTQIPDSLVSNKSITSEVQITEPTATIENPSVKVSTVQVGSQTFAKFQFTNTAALPAPVEESTVADDTASDDGGTYVYVPAPGTDTSSSISPIVVDSDPPPTPPPTPVPPPPVGGGGGGADSTGDHSSFEGLKIPVKPVHCMSWGALKACYR